jgi:C4-dicarboxylate transporter DctM subunit
MPLVVGAAVGPMNYSAIVAWLVVIGTNSLSAAPILYMACRIGQVSIRHVPSCDLYNFDCRVVVKLVMIFIPEISLFKPSMLGVL